METFRPVTDGDVIPILTDEVLHSLSWDQQCEYNLLKAVRSGRANSDIRNMQIGPLYHARWLTLACRTLYLYMCEHDLNDDDTANLVDHTVSILDSSIIKKL